MERKELGRIARIKFGWGGYQDAMIGLSITLEGKGWGVGDFKGQWGIARTEHAKWSEVERVTQLGELCLYIRDLLNAAHVQTIDKLEGVPVEATFDGNKLTSWRVLDEVLPHRSAA